MVIGSGVWDDVKSLIAGVLFSHAFSGELKAVSIVNEAVQNCVAEGGVADDVMPMFDGDLAGDDCRGTPMAVVKDLQKIASNFCARSWSGNLVAGRSRGRR